MRTCPWQAAQELAARAAAAEEPLLLELFGDADPLVREASLKALHAPGGERVSEALIRLLDDPEPNVRAAVLKQLAESPAASIVSTVAKYAAGEQDADLLVHAVRLLRATGGKATADSLMKLLEHASWRVRAEAAEALGLQVSFLTACRLVQSIDGSHQIRATARCEPIGSAGARRPPTRYAGPPAKSADCLAATSIPSRS